MTTSAPQPRWLDERENRAWRGWLTMSDLLHSQVAHDLQAETGLSDADFAVLVHLSEAADSRLRMSELADALRWSKSRLSHQFSRMEARGLVRRVSCPSDARSTFALLSACGRREIERAAPIHVESVRRHFIDLLDPDRLAAVADIADLVAGHLMALGTPSDAGVPPCPKRAALPTHSASAFPAPGAPALPTHSASALPAPGPPLGIRAGPSQRLRLVTPARLHPARHP